jgi:mitochondrial Rho GTPase 1
VTAQQLLWADTIVLVCSFDRIDSFGRVKSYWFRLFDDLALSVPIVLAVNKSDLVPPGHFDMSPAFIELTQDLKIDAYTKCSAKQLLHVDQVFREAQRACLFPVRPLYNAVSRKLKPKCVTALNRIFRIFDSDHDHLLNDVEFGDFHARAFGWKLDESRRTMMKAAMQRESPALIYQDAVTFDGFLHMARRIIENREVRLLWSMLEHFDYDIDLELRLNTPPVQAIINKLAKRSLDQSCELTEDALAFLRGVFYQFDLDRDGALSNRTPTSSTHTYSTWPSAFGLSELEEAFASSPHIPFPPNYATVASSNDQGFLDIDGWLSHWVMMAAADPVYTLHNLVYLGFDKTKLAVALRICPSKRADARQASISKHAISCVVYGAGSTGKTMLSNLLIRKPFREDSTPTSHPRTVANWFSRPLLHDISDDTKSTSSASESDADIKSHSSSAQGAFVMVREIPHDVSTIDQSLQPDGAAHAADLICLVYDGTRSATIELVNDLIPRLPNHIPCVVVQTKSDLEPSLVRVVCYPFFFFLLCCIAFCALPLLTSVCFALTRYLTNASIFLYVSLSLSLYTAKRYEG